MSRRPDCGNGRSWCLGDGRLKCRLCRCRFRDRAAWQASRLSGRVKTELVQRLVQRPQIAGGRCPVLGLGIEQAMKCLAQLDA